MLERAYARIVLYRDFTMDEGGLRTPKLYYKLHVMLLCGLGVRAGDLGKLIGKNELVHVFGCKNSTYTLSMQLMDAVIHVISAAWKMTERDKDKER